MDLVQSNLTLSSGFALFSAMVILAAMPSLSVLTVSARSATFGLTHGVLTSLGIVVGDSLFIVLALWGLAQMATTLGSLFIMIKGLGGVYLIWLGIGLYRSKPKDLESEKLERSSLVSSFMTGLLITLGDQKAILFYFGFFPAFLDISQVSYVDTAIIIAITIVAVGGVKLGYALMAYRAKGLFSAKLSQGIHFAAGFIMIAVGVVLIGAIAR